MKKMIVCLLVSCFCLGLIACGEKKENDKIKTTQSTVELTENNTEGSLEELSTNTDSETEPTTEEIETKKGSRDNAILSFDNELVIVEDDNVTVKLKGVFQEHVNWIDGAVMEKGIILSVTNNGDYEYLFNLEDLYLLDEGAIAVMNEGNDGPAPGKTKEYSYYINKDSKIDKTIEKINDLSGLNGNIALEVFSDDRSYVDTSKSYTIHFSFEDYKTQIDSLVNDSIDYSVDSTVKQDDVSSNTEVDADFNVIGTWYCLRGGTLEDTPEFKEDGTVEWNDESVCTWELKPEKNCVYLYYSEFDWGGDYAINEYNGYYLIQLDDITMVRKENYVDYIHSID